MGRMVMGGMTLQDEATGETTMWHDDGKGQHGNGRHDNGKGQQGDR